jgi:hypothetical protein
MGDLRNVVKRKLRPFLCPPGGKAQTIDRAAKIAREAALLEGTALPFCLREKPRAGHFCQK